MKRRDFIKSGAAATGTILLGKRGLAGQESLLPKRPNIVYVFADQWRAQAAGYAGDPNALTPHLDRLANESVNFANAVSSCAVCSPHRASLLTGQYPLTHGIFLNDALLSPDALSIAKVLKNAGYDTGYIGKWHLNGPLRSGYVPEEGRQGFTFWRAMDCTHLYNMSGYYGEKRNLRFWKGYDVLAQTEEACRFIEGRQGDSTPFALFLSWGPPHEPYAMVPGKYKKMIAPKSLKLRTNVPLAYEARARNALAGYYAHVAALDECVGRLLKTIDDVGISQDTIFVFSSDHGDMLYSQGHQKKQQPWDESVRVPFLLRYPARFGAKSIRVDAPINSPDIMPTLLSLCEIEIPDTVEGGDFSGVIDGSSSPPSDAALIACYWPFGQWRRSVGGKEYRGVRTPRYTFVRDLEGPWLLYDNLEDPYQMDNLCERPDFKHLQANLDELLYAKLKETNDDFQPGQVYINQWGYKVIWTGDIPFVL